MAGYFVETVYKVDDRQLVSSLSKIIKKLEDTEKASSAVVKMLASIGTAGKEAQAGVSGLNRSLLNSNDRLTVFNERGVFAGKVMKNMTNMAEVTGNQM